MIVRSPARRRAGFSLIEVIVAMSLIAVVTIILSTMAVAAGRRGRLVDLSTKRTLALSQQAGRVEAMPFTDVTKLTSGTTQMLIGDFSFTRVMTVTKTGTTRYTVKIVVKPIAGEFRADSVTLDRTRPPTGTPLCTTC